MICRFRILRTRTTTRDRQVLVDFFTCPKTKLKRLARGLGGKRVEAGIVLCEKRARRPVAPSVLLTRISVDLGGESGDEIF
jgi:hypothetical protein